jgi:hypothetical protein
LPRRAGKREASLFCRLSSDCVALVASELGDPESAGESSLAHEWLRKTVSDDRSGGDIDSQSSVQKYLKKSKKRLVSPVNVL